MDKAFRVSVLGGLLILVGGVVWLLAVPSSKPQSIGTTVLIPASTQQAEAPLPESTNDSVVMEPPAALSSPDDTQRLRKLETAVRSLTRQLRTQQRLLARQQEALAQLLGSRSAERKPSDADTAVADAEAAQSEETRGDQRAALLEAALATQDVSAEWSQAALEQIAATVDQVLDTLSPQTSDGLELVGTDCRSTLCRIEFVHENQEVMEHVVREIPQQIGWQTNGHMRVISNPDGSSSAVLYLSRDGYSLPKSEN
jgi:hypothetical protein